MPEIVDLGSYEEPEEQEPGNEDPQALIEARNRALIDEIRALGAEIPPFIIQQVQMDMMLDLLWPQGSPTRKLYDLMVEDRLTSVLESLKSSATRARLTQGV